MDLYFFSPTCVPCKQVSPKVDAAIKTGASIRKVDVSIDTGRFVARLFGVIATPAYVKFNQTALLVGDVAVAREFE